MKVSKRSPGSKNFKPFTLVIEVNSREDWEELEAALSTCTDSGFKNHYAAGILNALRRALNSPGDTYGAESKGDE